MYTLTLAWKYATSRWVNLTAVIAVALALLVQIVVMAVLDGMLEQMQKRLREIDGHVYVNFFNFPHDMPSKPEMEAFEKTLKLKFSDVISVTPYTTAYGALQKGGTQFFMPVVAFGIDLKKEAPLSSLRTSTLHHTIDPKNPTWADDPQPGIHYIIIGKGLANNLNLNPGDDVWFNFLRPGEEKPRKMKFRYSSSFNGGFIGSDWQAYIPIDSANKIRFGDDALQRNGIQCFKIWLKNPQKAEQLRQNIEDIALDRIGLPLNTYTWQSKWRDISSGMKYENDLQQIVLTMMNISGGFCVFAIMATLVSRRSRDVGLLRSMGASKKGVILTFINVGLILGICGALLGLLGGYVLAQPGLFNIEDGKEQPLLNYIFMLISGHDLYPPHMFEAGSIEPVLGLRVFLYTAGAALISVIASVYPAVTAGSSEPVEALRDD